VERARSTVVPWRRGSAAVPTRIGASLSTRRWSRCCGNIGTRCDERAAALGTELTRDAFVFSPAGRFRPHQAGHGDAATRTPRRSSCHRHQAPQPEALLRHRARRCRSRRANCRRPAGPRRRRLYDLADLHSLLCRRPISARRSPSPPAVCGGPPCGTRRVAQKSLRSPRTIMAHSPTAGGLRTPWRARRRRDRADERDPNDQLRW
jgi:hypothetical protein